MEIVHSNSVKALINLHLRASKILHVQITTSAPPKVRLWHPSPHWDVKCTSIHDYKHAIGIYVYVHIYIYIHNVICFTKQHNTCTTPHKQYCMVHTFDASFRISIVINCSSHLPRAGFCGNGNNSCLKIEGCALVPSNHLQRYQVLRCRMDSSRLWQIRFKIATGFPSLLYAPPAAQGAFSARLCLSMHTNSLRLLVLILFNYQQFICCPFLMQSCNVWMSRSVGDKVTIEAVPLLSTQTLHSSKTAAPVLSGSFNNFIVKWKFREAHIRIAMLILSVDSIVCPAPQEIGSGGFPQTNMFCLLHGSIPETNEVGKVREKICRNNIHR